MLPDLVARVYESRPAFLLYSNMSMTSGTQIGSVSARCTDDSSSLMMAENVGRSLKLHIQQYFIRSYLKLYNHRNLGQNKGGVKGLIQANSWFTLAYQNPPTSRFNIVILSFLYDCMIIEL